MDWGPLFGSLFVTRGLTFDHLPVCVSVLKEKENELGTYSPRLEGPSSPSSSSLASTPNRY